MNGPFQLGTGYQFVDFTDGLSNTLLVGEKQVAVGRHGVGWADCSLYNGAFPKCSTRAVSRTHPLTTDPHDGRWLFGSRHTNVVLFCFADGRVRSLSTSTDPYTLELLGMRSDGAVIPDY